MPEMIADSPDERCFSLHSGSGIEENQSLAPDPFSPRAPARARDGRGRFAKGQSGNPAGRPRGIRNPKRRVLTLQAWRANPQAASALLDRKPRLLRPLLAQALPPARPRRVDPAERLGISVRSLHDAADFQRAMQAVCAAVAAGAHLPREAGRIARQVRARMRALRRLARVQRRLGRLCARLRAVSMDIPRGRAYASFLRTDGS